MLRVGWVEVRLVVLRAGHRWVGSVRRGMETALCSLVLWLLREVWRLLLLLFGLEKERSAQVRREVLRVGWAEVRLVVPRVGHRWAW